MICINFKYCNKNHQFIIFNNVCHKIQSMTLYLIPSIECQYLATFDIELEHHLDGDVPEVIKLKFGKDRVIFLG